MPAAEESEEQPVRYFRITGRAARAMSIGPNNGISI
jgi:hypothetical protein